MGKFLNLPDLSPFAPSMTQEQADQYIDGIEARAEVEAPCITAPDFEYEAVVKDILREAVLRRHRALDGGVTQQQVTAGSFNFGQSIDSRVYSNGSLTKSDIRQLKALCRLAAGVGSGRKAFTVRPR